MTTPSSDCANNCGAALCFDQQGGVESSITAAPGLSACGLRPPLLGHKRAGFPVVHTHTCPGSWPKCPTGWSTAAKLAAKKGPVEIPDFRNTRVRGWYPYSCCTCGRKAGLAREQVDPVFGLLAPLARTDQVRWIQRERAPNRRPFAGFLLAAYPPHAFAHASAWR